MVLHESGWIELRRTRPVAAHGMANAAIGGLAFPAYKTRIGVAARVAGPAASGSLGDGAFCAQWTNGCDASYPATHGSNGDAQAIVNFMDVG